MDEFRARRVVDSLRDRGVNAHLFRGGGGKFGVRVPLSGGREAEWDSDGTASLEALVKRDGMLVGYVPRIEGSEDFDEYRIVDAIVRTDYDQPVAHQRAFAPAPPAALPREGGVFRRFLDGFRYRLSAPGGAWRVLATDSAGRSRQGEQIMTPQQKTLVAELRAADYPVVWKLTATAADDKLVIGATPDPASVCWRSALRRHLQRPNLNHTVRQRAGRGAVSTASAGVSAS
jgi:hypothetical protein